MLPDVEPRQTGVADRHYYGRQFEATLVRHGITVLRPARAGEKLRPGDRLFRPLPQVIESIIDTFEGQHDLEHHGGHTPLGVWVRILQRALVLTAAIWHDDHIGAPTPRSLIAYDHWPSESVIWWPFPVRRMAVPGPADP